MVKTDVENDLKELAGALHFDILTKVIIRSTSGCRPASSQDSIDCQHLRLDNWGCFLRELIRVIYIGGAFGSPSAFSCVMIAFLMDV